jgi:hypothetical protein
MKFHAAVITIILVSMLTLSATYYISDLGSHYSTTADFTDLNNSFERMNDTNKRMNTIHNKIQEMTLQKEGSNTLYNVYKMIQVAWESTKAMLFSWTTLFSIVTDLINASPIKLPTWLLSGLITMITTMLVAMIIYAFFKWKIES